MSIAYQYCSNHKACQFSPNKMKLLRETTAFVHTDVQTPVIATTTQTPTPTPMPTQTPVVNSTTVTTADPADRNATPCLCSTGSLKGHKTHNSVYVCVCVCVCVCEERGGSQAPTSCA